MQPETEFFIYLAALICLLLATLGEAWKYGARTRKGMAPVIALMPLGIALAILPTLWRVGEAAF